MHRKAGHLRGLIVGFYTAFFISGCSMFAPPSTPVSIAPTQEIPDFLQPSHFLIVNQAAETATPFQPLPVTGTPPPTSTPVPTAAPTATPTPTPWLQPVFAPPSIPIYGIPAPFPLLSPEHHINFLLLGSDSRGGASFRTDVIMIAMVDPHEKTVSLISIPRDLYVYIPGWTMNRINTAFLHGKLNGYTDGGPGLIKDTIRYNLGIQIDHVALVDFNGFRNIINTAGGIDIPLVCSFKEWTVINPNISIEYESNWELTTIGPGIVHMDGDMALWYARARMRSNDFDRGRRQQEVIRALFNTALEENLILQAPQLFEDFQDTVTTDVDIQTLLSLVPLGLDLDEAQIRSFYISSDLTWGWTTPSGASVLLPNAQKIYNMILEALSPPEEIAKKNKPVVNVWNWTNQKDWDDLAAERLHYAGFETNISSGEDNDARKTVLYDYTPDQIPEVSASILKILGLQNDRLINDPQSDSDVQFRLILGSDYDPCFNPAKP